MTTDDRIMEALEQLKFARVSGDELTIELAEDGLNDLLDRQNVTPVTRNDKSKGTRK